MKIKLTNLATLAFIAAALTAAPAISRAADPTNAPATTAPTPVRHLPFHGKIVAVDTNAMTFTVGATTFSVGSTTRIFKGGKPAVLADIPVGENVSGSYKKDNDGKATALLVRVVPPRRPQTAPGPATPAPAPAAGPQ